MSKMKSEQEAAGLSKREIKKELKSFDDVKGGWQTVFKSAIIAAINLRPDIIFDRERYILEGYCNNKSVAELSKELEIGPYFVRDVATRALSKLSERLNLEGLYEQLESMKAETEQMREKVKILSETAGECQSKQDLMKIYLMMQQYDVECSEKVALLKQSIKELHLTVKTKNALLVNGFRTIGDIVSHSEEDMMKVSHLGPKGFNEIKTCITNLGLSFGMDVNHIIEKDLQAWYEKRR